MVFKACRPWRAATTAPALGAGLVSMKREDRRVQGIHQGRGAGRENYTYGTWSCASPGPF